jgi:hypothetical protein
MTWLWGWIGAAIAGAVGWYATAFFAGPMRSFFDLRREVRRQTLLINEEDFWVRSGLDGLPDSREEAKAARKLDDARRLMRDLGSQLIAFAETEWLAARTLQCLGYDPKLAGRHMRKFATCLSDFGPEPGAQLSTVALALRFKASKVRSTST